LAIDVIGIALLAQNQASLAEPVLRQSVALRPTLPEVHYNLGNTLKQLGRNAEAAECYRQALQLRPHYIEALNNLGTALDALGRLDEALDCYRQALARRPDLAELHDNLGKTFSRLGRLPEAVASYRQALALQPGNAETHSGKLFALAYAALVDGGTYLAEARRFEIDTIPATVREAAARWRFPGAGPRGRRLRIGYLSQDFRNHAISFFIEQLFAGHDREKFEVYAYSAGTSADLVTARLQGLVEHWVPINKPWQASGTTRSTC
jgi:predicted O-linked N-acetylglucosamine transferase (SPINDLY family)